MFSRAIAISFTALFAATAITTAASAADTYMPACFKPAEASTNIIKAKNAHPGPYRIALVNGFVANTWRQQMIKTAQAYVLQPDVKKKVKELKVVSVGEDFPAQLAAIDDFINQGYDAVLISPESGTGFDRVIRHAQKAGTVLIGFNGGIQTHDIVQITQNQVDFGREWAKFVVAHMPKPEGTILEVAGISGNPADNDRHAGQMEVLKDYPKIKVVTVFGKWDDGTAQRVTADALAAHPDIDGMIVSGGSTGAVRALIDAHHKFIPVAGEAENGFRKLIAQYGKDGLQGISIGNSPGQSAISILAAVSLLEGKSLPDTVELPNPTATNDTLKAGVNYYPDLSDNFFTPNQFPPCGVDISGPEIMAQPEAK
jgi:ribose transport system substrate-binding protein